mgnify:CR=1 FL=1
MEIKVSGSIMGTAITLSIGATTVSDDVKHIEIWADANAVGRFKFQLDNVGGQYNGTFAVNNPVEIDIAGATIMEGWIDAIHPIVSSDIDVFAQRLEITGRDFGRELVDLTADKYYTYQPGDTIIDNLLIISSSNITMTSSALATSMSYDSKNEYLLNSFRKICERTGQDFYIDDNGALQLFNAGSKDSNITLQATTGGGTNNNIISLERDHAEGTDIKNKIVVRGKQVTDGWTELNAGNWTVPVNATATNDTTAYVGVYSVKFTKGTATDSYLELDFSAGLYGRTYLDWSKVSQGEISFYINFAPVTQGEKVTIYLTDTNNNVISKTFNETYLSLILANSDWGTITNPVGTECKIITVSILNVFSAGDWIYHSGSSFNWLVKKIKIHVLKATSFYIDGLKLPSKMISTAQNGASQNSYGVREIVIDKLDIESQVELDAYSARYLALHKDPFTTLRITAIGDIGITAPVHNWKPGYICMVNVPGEGISNVSYRMMSIHHVYDTDNTNQGHDYWVVLDLVLTSDALDIRRLEAQTSEVSLLRELREMLSVLQQNEDVGVERYPALPAQLGSHYLISAIQYDMYWEAESAPVVLATGTDVFADATANNEYCARRESTDSSGDMLDIHTSVPGSNEYVVYFRLKVTSNASSSTIATVRIYNETNSVVVKTMTISPDLFDASDSWNLVAIRASLSSLKEYSFGIVSFVTGITNLYCDWVSITDSPVPYAIVPITILSGQGVITIASGAVPIIIMSGIVPIVVQSGQIVISITSTSVHLHDVSYVQGYIPITYGGKYALSAGGSADRYALDTNAGGILYAAATAGGSPDTAFFGLPSTVNIYSFKSIPTATTFDYFEATTSSYGASVTVGTATNTGGGHNHAYDYPYHNHSTTSTEHIHDKDDTEHSHPGSSDSGHSHGSESKQHKH